VLLTRLVSFIVYMFLLALTRFQGKSDPFAVFVLNGMKVFTSETKKKTLNPDWSESFEVSVVCLFTVY
jgi:Ca2+-dependent lipid-binding protein